MTRPPPKSPLFPSPPLSRPPDYTRLTAATHQRNERQHAPRHDALQRGRGVLGRQIPLAHAQACPQDRKSTRLNSSHSQISYAVFCLKKKKKNKTKTSTKVNY